MGGRQIAVYDGDKPDGDSMDPVALLGQAKFGKFASNIGAWKAERDHPKDEWQRYGIDQLATEKDNMLTSKEWVKRTRPRQQRLEAFLAELDQLTEDVAQDRHNLRQRRWSSPTISSAVGQEKEELGQENLEGAARGTDASAVDELIEPGSINSDKVLAELTAIRTIRPPSTPMSLMAAVG